MAAPKGGDTTKLEGLLTEDSKLVSETQASKNWAGGGNFEKLHLCLLKLSCSVH
jgi:hypothetical protein